MTERRTYTGQAVGLLGYAPGQRCVLTYQRQANGLVLVQVHAAPGQPALVLEVTWEQFEKWWAKEAA